MLAVCPNSSVAVKTTAWSSVPNLPMSTIRGREQFSASPPSNEHVTDTTSLVNVQSNVCLPTTPLVPQTPSNAVQETHIKFLQLTRYETSYLAVVEEFALQFVTNISDYFFDSLNVLRAIRLKLNETTSDRPNTSTTVTTRV